LQLSTDWQQHSILQVLCNLWSMDPCSADLPELSIPGYVQLSEQIVQCFTDSYCIHEPDHLQQCDLHEDRLEWRALRLSLDGLLFCLEQHLLLLLEHLSSVHLLAFDRQVRLHALIFSERLPRKSSKVHELLSVSEPASDPG
jgi:hypothetical protein